jgi:radical SAM superfamily enzyme YgiQ (UPF0313 family)
MPIDEWRSATDAPVVLYFPNLYRPANARAGKGRTLFGETNTSRAPLPVLALAGVLDLAGYRVRIVDAVMHEDFEAELLAATQGAICLGISSIAGYQVHEALEIAKLVRRRNPSLPIVWGGWFPTLLTEQAVRDPHVDVVVRGQGEATFLELVHRYSTGRPIDDVRGIAYERDGQVVCTPERPVVDANQLPPLPYHLLDMQQKLQPDPRGKRTTSYFTSYGCPYRCTFCSNDAVFGPRWYALTPERVVEDMERLVQWGANHLVIDDANFFVSRKRVRRMCELIVERGLEGRITWDATGTANVVARFDEELLTLLRRGGCSAIFIGAESGSQELIDVFRKPITGEHVVQSADKLGRHGIVPYIGFVVGTPGEPADALARTVDLAARIYRANPAADVQQYFFSPIPGAMLSEAPSVQSGFVERPPASLAEWAQRFGESGGFVYRWTQLETPFEYRRTVIRFNRLTGVANRPPPGAPRWLARVLRRVALYRLQHSLLGLPTVEARLLEAVSARG